MVEPVTIFLVLSALLSISTVASIALWPKILTWVDDHLRPYLQRNHPELVGLLARALIPLDGLAVEARRAAREAWRQIRSRLLKHLVTIERNTDGRWTVKTVSWLRQLSEQGTPQVTQVRAERVVPFDELPADVRAAYLRSETHRRKIDVTRTRDQEIGLLNLST
jgi:hypothetical protein